MNCTPGFPGSSGLVKKTPECSGDLQFSLVGKICRRRERKRRPSVVGLPGGLAGKESACRAGDLGSTLVGILEKGALPLQCSGSESSMGLYSPCSHKEFGHDMTGATLHFHHEGKQFSSDSYYTWF